MSVPGLTGPAEDSVSPNRAVIQVSRPVHARLTAIKDAKQQQLRRQVTFTEIIEQLLEQEGA